MDAGLSHPGSAAASYTVSCASDHEESTFLKRYHHLRWAQLALSVVCFGSALAIIGCEAVPFQHYRSTSGYEEAGLALWPLNFDLRPTIAILSSGCVIAVLNLVYIVAVLIPSPHSHIRRLNIVASGTAVAGLIAAAVGLAFAIYLPQSTYPGGFSHNETLHSWTCKWKAMRSVTSSENASLHAPTHFERDCSETRAGFVLLALLIGLEVVGGAVGAFGVWLERNVSRQRSFGAQVEKETVLTKDSNRV
ncbi:hypothetical protein IFM58399_03014 [Aspergillus lentulus]|uniref:Uncharacterized protein n=1 Tax=Aspergillus lentulus TaxID=293939 RepID=A0AAN5YIL5_ASPLE|nr:uncharacterized protein IFM58399_03014 [Aspergillus lentulus]KAF4153718.1 hypothetical protein CNMCM6069_000341 [Aspergillus lentulus]KAF4165959.1 hypothetical protein CNMCM6936_007156 [Aspergillus lentulus]KAF4173405.1 hypothetical protein CNMCM8060_000191 [Aspergillus lentulus]KAF4188087.1 hypothetical protein CNMCM7927_002579 [Aspergillus lentulus]KAF4192435.1 hypothetical protein CNMCM8694_000492 [Aspergillus lentulus]